MYSFTSIPRPIVLDIESDDLSAKHDPDTRVYLVGLYDINADTYELLESHERVTERVGDYLKDSAVTFVIHNAAFDVACLRLRGIDIPPGRYVDTMLAAFLLDTAQQSVSLDTLTNQKVDLYAGLQAVGYTGSKDDMYSSFGSSHVVDDVFRTYLRGDLKATASLYERLALAYGQDPKALRQLDEVDTPYIEVIMELEAGAYIDTSLLSATAHDLNRLTEEALAPILTEVPYAYTNTKSYKKPPYKRHGILHFDNCPLEEFNPGSGDQVARVLQERYGWEPTKESRTTGKPSVDTATLEASPLSFVNLLLRHRKLAKLSQFPVSLDEHRDGNIIRPSYKQCGTRTTRLSCSKPNIQQIPSRDEEGKKVRELFVAPPGYLCVVGDAANLQLRIIAAGLEHYFQDTRMSEAFVRGEDVHQLMADIYGIDRKVGKNVTFAYAFGAQAPKIAATASRGGKQVSEAYITKALTNLEERMPALPAFKQLVVNHATSNGGEFHLWSGGKITVTELLSNQKWLRASGERKAFNYFIQGTEAVLMRMAGLVGQEVAAKYDAKACLAVHDELMYIVDESLAEELSQELTRKLGSHDYFPSVKLGSGLRYEFDFAVGTNWLEAKG